MRPPLFCPPQSSSSPPNAPTHPHLHPLPLSDGRPLPMQALYGRMSLDACVIGAMIIIIPITSLSSPRPP